MIRKILLAAPLFIALGGAAFAQPAGQPVQIQDASNPTLKAKVETNGSVDVQCISGCAGSGGSSAVNATSTLPTLAPGAQTPQGSLAGAAYVQPAFGTASGGGTQVDSTHGLPVAQATASLLNATVVGGGGAALATSALQTSIGATAHTDSGTINTTLGTPFQAGGSIGNTSFIATQATAANLNATVVNAAGSAIMGKVGIDQTTPGTTNLVAAGQNGTWTVQPGNTANTTAWKVDGSAVTQPVAGVAANNATQSGNPAYVGATAVNAEPTLATNGQNAGLVTDLAHKLIVAPYANPENLVNGTTAAMTGTTSTSLIGVPGAGLHNYITQISCVNSHATVGTFVTVQDGSGGTALLTLAAAAVYGGHQVSFPAPLRQPTANTALFVADVTTGANVICSATGYKGQ